MNIVDRREGIAEEEGIDATVAVRVEHLRKTYRSARRLVVAVDDLDLVVPRGGVFGFLGPNGSGKTSTIRAMTGLMRAFEGSIEVLGYSIPERIDDVMDRVGALVETPSFFPAYSGRRNLSLLARSRGIPLTRVDETMELVGLSDRSRDPVRTYSLGMRQRLGLATTLLKDPELLILDEPANGLDPDGMREMRRTLRNLCEEGRTVLVSSHLLGEVEQLCDRVAVLSRGRCVFAGSVAELIGRSTAVRVLLHGDERTFSQARTATRRAGFDVIDARGAELTIATPPADAWRLVRVLAGQDIWVREIGPIERTLEDSYVELVHGAPGQEVESTW